MVLNLPQFNNFNSKDINPNDLVVKIDALEKTIKSLEQQVGLLQDKSDRVNPDNLINRNLDVDSKKIIEEIVINSFMDIFWDYYYYYSSTFESIDRYLTPATGAVQTINDDGMTLQTDGTLNNETGFTLTVSSDLLSIDKEARFRVSNRLDSTSNVTWEALTLMNSGATDYIGFRMKDGTIYGLSSNNSTVTALSLQSYSANTNYKLELRYYPGYKIVFYIDDKELGTITTNLPSATPVRIFDIGIGATAAAAKESITTYYEFIQRK